MIVTELKLKLSRSLFVAVFGPRERDGVLVGVPAACHGPREDDDVSGREHGVDEFGP